MSLCSPDWDPCRWKTKTLSLDPVLASWISVDAGDSTIRFLYWSVWWCNDSRFEAPGTWGTTWRGGGRRGWRELKSRYQGAACRSAPWGQSGDTELLLLFLLLHFLFFNSTFRLQGSYQTDHILSFKLWRIMNMMSLILKTWLSGNYAVLDIECNEQILYYTIYYSYYTC